MIEERVQRRRAAILAADVVGYRGAPSTLALGAGRTVETCGEPAHLASAPPRAAVEVADMGDLDEICRLLAEGFPNLTAQRWRDFLSRFQERRADSSLALWECFQAGLFKRPRFSLWA